MTVLEQIKASDFFTNIAPPVRVSITEVELFRPGTSEYEEFTDITGAAKASEDWVNCIVAKKFPGVKRTRDLFFNLNEGELKWER